MCSSCAASLPCSQLFVAVIIVYSVLPIAVFHNNIHILSVLTFIVQPLNPHAAADGQLFLFLNNHTCTSMG
jgi:hypothetical protein